MRRPVVFLVLATLIFSVHVPAANLFLPLAEKSVRFAVIGDFGTGSKRQYELGREMAKFRELFPFDFALTLGDNIYGGDSPSDMKRKFELPYKDLLDAGVKFYASLGNHDNPNQRFYKPFNMGEKRYYSFKKGNAEFFALDSSYMDPTQMNWLKQSLEASNAEWKICYFHHPLYSDGKRHGPDEDLRKQIEPLLEKYGVQVVLAGHEHFYERLLPQKGLHHFIMGNSGQLRVGNLRKSPRMAKGFDRDLSFMAVEIAGDELHFQAVSRNGETVDSGVISRPSKTTSSQ
jgi:hypothetical protein